MLSADHEFRIKMRHSVLRHNLSMACLLCLAGSLEPQAAHAQPVVEPAELLSITADTAWESAEDDSLQFEGDFVMTASSWSASADRARVYGPLDQPDRVVLEGGPARFTFSPADDLAAAWQGSIAGAARVIEYVRSLHSLRIEGEAHLTQGVHEMHSESIEFDLKSGLLRAEGRSGVRLSVPGSGREREN